LNFGQQLYQQQASQTQQVFQQQQQGVIDRIRAGQAKVERLDAAKQQMFEQYLNMSESDKAAVRDKLSADYLNLDQRGKAGWQRDAVVQNLIGPDLPRLDALGQYREMNAADQARFRQAMLQKYRALTLPEQQSWQSDKIVGSILGKDWWLK
jgi:hypothetical protein